MSWFWIKAATVPLALLGLLEAPGAGAQTASVPAELQPPSGLVLVLRASAKGAQIYTCTAKAAGGGFDWVLKAPDAELYDTSGAAVAKHYAGPTWQATDGSKIVGEVAARADAPGGESIPWLLLRARSSEGAGLFGAVSYVQRLETTGGLPPSSGCDAAHAGAEARVPYTAIYAFYRAG